MADPKNTTMASPQNGDDVLDAALEAEMKRRGLAVPGGSIAPSGGGGAPAAGPSAVSYDAMGNVTSTGGEAQEAQPAPAGGGIVERAVMDIAKGVAVEGPGAIVRGIGNAAKETGDLISETMQGADTLANKVGLSASAAQPALRIGAAGMQWMGEKLAGLFDKRETVTGNVIESVSQLATGIIGPGKFVSLPKTLIGTGLGGKIVQGMARGAVADATVFDGNDKRLSNLLEDYPGLWSPVTNFLAAKDDDPEALGRIKNALEGLIIGPVADMFIAALSARKAFARGDIAKGRSDVELVQEIEARMAAGVDEATAEVPQVAAKAADEVPPAAAVVEPPKPEYINGEYVIKDGPDPKLWARGDTPSEALASHQRHLEVAQNPQPPVFAHHELNEMESAANALRSKAELTPGEAKQVELAREDLQNSSGRPATDQEVADYLQEGVAADRARHAEAAKASDEGIPPVEKIEGPRAADEAAPPYSTDLPMPAGNRGPVEFKAGDVLPNVSKADGERTVAALNAKFSAAGRAMVEDGADFNFRTVTNDDDLKAALNAVSAANADMITRTKGGDKITLKETMKLRDELADTFGADPDRMLIALGNDAKTLVEMHARFQTYKGMMLSVVNDAANKADAYLALPKGSPEAVKASAEALHSAMLAAQMTAMVKGIQTGTARTMSAMRLSSSQKMMKSGINDYEELSRRLAEGTFHSDDEKLLRHIASLRNNPKGFSKYVEKTFGQRLGGAYQEWLLNAMLSGPKTHVANLLGNTAMTAYMPLERAVQGMMWGSGKSSYEVLRGLKDEYDGLGMALLDSFRIAGTALKQNKSILDPNGGSHLDPNGGNVGGLSARGLGLTNDFYRPDGTLIRTETTPILSTLMDGVQTLVGIPSRLLTGGDELFKQLNYRSYLYTDAAAKADSAGLKRGTDEWKNYVSQEMTRGFDENGVAAAVSENGMVRGINGQNSMQGLQQAREATFTQNLEGGLGRWVQGASNDNVWLKTVIPFVRTPTNIFRFALRHGPLAPLSYGFIRDLRMGGEPARKAMAQLTTGSAMWALGAWLADNEVITGGFSPNPEVRKGQEMNGAKEYAIRVGDQYIQYNRLDPFATVLGMAADFNKLRGFMTEPEADKLAMAMTITIARNLAGKTYVQGMTNMFNAIGDVLSGRAGGTKGLESFAYRTAASIAIPSIMGTFKDDEALREVRNMLDAFKARLPGHSKDVPPVRNVLGEVVDAPQGWLLGPASPLGYGRDKNDVVYKELGRMMEVNESPITRIVPTLSETKIDLREVKLATGQNAYDRLQQLLWNSGVKEELRKQMTGPGWAKLTEGTPDYPNAPGTKLYVTNTILQRYKHAAQQQLLAENPDLLSMYRTEVTRAKTEGVRGPQPKGYEKPKFLESIIGK